MNRSKPADLHVWPDWIDEVVEELKGCRFNAETLRAVILQHAPLDSFVRRVDVANLEAGDALLVQLPSGLDAKLHTRIVQNLRVQVAQVCPGAQVVATTDVVEVVGLLRPPRTAEAKPTRPARTEAPRPDGLPEPDWTADATAVCQAAYDLSVVSYGSPEWRRAVAELRQRSAARVFPYRVERILGSASLFVEAMERSAPEAD